MPTYSTISVVKISKIIFLFEGLFDGNGYPGSLQGASAVDAPDANHHSELRFDENHWLTLP